MPSQKQPNISQAYLGLNMDSSMGQKKPGQLSYALNAQVQGFDGEAIIYQSEQSNDHCLNFPEGYKVMGGPFNIPQINKVIYFISNDKGGSEIGYTDNNDCTYTTLIKGGCLNLSTEHPIHQIVLKSVNCATQFYWTDNWNQRRYLDLNNLPWKEKRNPDNDFRPIQLVGELDCNKMLVQPHYSIPQARGVKELLGGSLKMGTYQAIIQYANVNGEGLTSFFNASNPFSVFKKGEIPQTDAVTNKAIEYHVSYLDTTGLFDFFNVAIVKNINDSISIDLVGRGIPIASSTAKFIYTGNETNTIALNPDDIFLKQKYFDRAGGVYEVDGVIGWYDLTSAKDVNYQEIANNIQVYWETHKIPYNNFEGYNNGANTESYKGYMRDEVYTLGLVLVYRNGMETHETHIPGRLPQPTDLIGIDLNNKDSVSILNNPCDEPKQKLRWEVYNTASILGFSQEFLDYKGAVDCYKGPYQYGLMGYWESGKKYPNNPIVWGDLAGKPIRHHKMPDSIITHIHDNNITGDKSFQHSIFPLGIRVEGVWEAIQNSSLTQEQKDSIIGFKIVRGNRASNKSIIAKGMFNNVGKYTYVPTDITEEDSQTYYYPNYPFNDLRKDPYFTDRLLKHHSGFRPDRSIDGFGTEESKDRFVFYSPDTQFERPTGIDSGHIKLETVAYGEAYGHFVPVDDNAKYLFLNKNGYKIAYGAGIASTVNGTLSYETPWSYGVGGNLSPENFPTTYQAMMDLLEKILPKTNFAYSFNSVGYYNKYFPIPNEGDKIRNIEFGKYLKPEYETIEAGNMINNYQRENSVYLNTTGGVLFPHQYDPSIPEDTSRYNLSSYTNNENYNKFLPIFLTNPDVVTDADIYQGIVDSFFGGQNVVNIQYTGNSSVPVTGDEIEIWTVPTATNPTGKKLGAMTIIDYGYNNSGTAFDGDFTAIMTEGDIETISLYLQLDSSDHSGSAAATTVYKSYFPQRIKYVNKNFPSPVQFGFDTLVHQSYQNYVLGRQSATDFTTSKARYYLGTIHSEEDIDKLNIIHPVDNEDFYKIVAYNAYIISYTRFQQTLEQQYSADKVRQANICSYYGSIKKYVIDQWGDIYSYETIDTGFYSPIRDEQGNAITKYPTIFGGDIFINRYAFKTKLPFFEDNSVGLGDNADMEFDKMATLTYPMFWTSTRPSEIRSSITAYIERKVKNIISNGQTFSAFNLLVAGIAAINISFEILKEVLAGLGVRNLNLDNFRSESLYEQGLFYMFAYGVPYYFCESEVNVDYRQATNSREGNFYPNAAGEIPDEWFQEANVSIMQPEEFHYNISYSKQNKENYFSRLRLDFDPNNACYYYYNNQTVWSDRSSVEETKNNWLTYRPANLFNFEKSYGKLISLDKLQNKIVLARFENKSQLYNAMVRINTSSPEAAYVGNDSLFSGTPPIDLSIPQKGSMGSQNKFILITEAGSIFVDARRGQVVVLRGQEPTDITTDGMDKWFKHFLPFAILKVNPNIPTDNHFTGIGLTGTYDSLYKRAIITKRDYEPLVEGIIYNENGEFIYNGKVVSLNDSNYFCDKSWTLSYSFITQSWTSFHSYQPNFYVEHDTYFQSGINGNTSSLWNHSKSFTSYHNFYGTTYPYILEYPVSFTFEDEILQGIRDYTKSLKYLNYETFVSPDKTHYFNKAIIYNDQQCSGILNLVPKSGLSAYGKFPKYNADSKDIQVTKSDNYFNFNQFWNITKDPDVAIWNPTCSFKYTNKLLNLSNLDYSNKAYTKATMRARECYVRLIEDKDSSVRLISRFIITPSSPSKL